MHDYWLACSNHRTVCIQAHDWNERVPFQGCNRPGTRLTYQEHQGYTKSSASFTGLPHHPDNSEGLHNWVDPQISFWTVPVSTQPKKSLLGHWEVDRSDQVGTLGVKKVFRLIYLFIYLTFIHCKTTTLYCGGESRNFFLCFLMASWVITCMGEAVWNVHGCFKNFSYFLYNNEQEDTNPWGRMFKLRV